MPVNSSHQTEVPDFSAPRSLYNIEQGERREVSIRHERFERLISGATEHAIFMMDSHGVILTWNPGVERVLGYSEDDWVGQHATIIFTPEDRASSQDEREREAAAENGCAQDIRWHVRRDGSCIWTDGVVTPLYDDVGTMIGFGKVMRDATDRKRAQTALRDAEERLRRAGWDLGSKPWVG